MLPEMGGLPTEAEAGMVLLAENWIPRGFHKQANNTLILPSPLLPSKMNKISKASQAEVRAYKCKESPQLL